MLVLLLVPAAAAERSPGPSDKGFPLEEYLAGVLEGRLYVAGAPPAVVGAKTKDRATIAGGKAHYQPQVALRRAGRDDGRGKFVVLKARSWGSAIAYVLKLDPGIVRFFRIAFPKGIAGSKFPTLYAGITYEFAVAADSPSPEYQPVDVASAPHPDRALARKGVALVTFKRGFTPGTYVLKVTSEVGLRPHPLRTLYEAYGAFTGAKEWLTIAVAPGEVALEKLVDKAIELLVDKAAAGDPKAIATLGKQATREAIVKKKLEQAVTKALTKTEAFYKLTIPTTVPDVRQLTQKEAQARLAAYFLRWRELYEPTTTPELYGRVKSQSIAPGQKRKVGTRVTYRLYVPAPPKPPGTTTPAPGTVVAISSPRVVDKIKALGYTWEYFNVVACDPRKAGSCDPRNAGSDIRLAAREFCRLNGTTAPPSQTNAGMRVGGQTAPYRGEAANPGTTRTTAKDERWVVVQGQFEGFVGLAAGATVFSSVNCLA